MSALAFVLSSGADISIEIRLIIVATFRDISPSVSKAPYLVINGSKPTMLKSFFTKTQSFPMSKVFDSLRATFATTY